MKVYIRNNNICRHFFFDPCPVIDLDCLVVDFQHVRSLDLASMDKLEAIGQIDHPFIEQMMMRFISYVARIPVDRPDDAKENEYIKELVGNILLRNN